MIDRLFRSKDIQDKLKDFTRQFANIQADINFALSLQQSINIDQILRKTDSIISLFGEAKSKEEKEALVIAKRRGDQSAALHVIKINSLGAFPPTISLKG